MPPPLQVDDEQLLQEAASSSDSDEVIELDSPVHVHAQPPTPQFEQEPQEKPQQQLKRQASPAPVPLVVSDIVTNTVADTLAPFGTPALRPRKPAQVKMNPGHKGKKRPRDRTVSAPIAKRRRGNRRSMPCIYCVRRLANDPKWACHDVLSQSGSAHYSGLRCSECVVAHVTCDMIPEQAKEAVWTLVKAAADVVASAGGAGTNKVQLLAAYEAAIIPALRAVFPNPPEFEAQRKKLRRNPGSKYLLGQSSTKSKHQGPAARAEASQLSSFSAGASQQPQLYPPADLANFFAPPQPPPLPQPPLQDGHDPHGADVEKLERQALRRRKVEALESLAHTAAIFLAEFMTFAKQQSSPSSPAHNQGMEYAAAAAGLVGAARAVSPPVRPSGRDASPPNATHHASSIFQPLAGDETAYHHQKPYRNGTSGGAPPLAAEEDSDSDSDGDSSSDVSTIENDPAPWRENYFQQGDLPTQHGDFRGDMAAAYGSNGVVQKRHDSEEARQVLALGAEDE